MEISDSFGRRIELIPGADGWSHTSKGFLKLAAKLVEWGLSEDEALEVLDDAYWCVANEFGA